MSEEPENHKDKLILIVEDSDVQAEVRNRMLTREGFQTAIAHDGAEGLALAQTLKPALILTDVVMPVMDGYRMCREIKDSEALRDIPVVLLTQLYEPEELIRGLECGADAYITKTVGEDLFMAKILSLLNNQLQFQNRSDLKCVSFDYQNKRYELHADRAQTLSFLISTYESAVWQNRELKMVQDQLRALNSLLEDKVDERTRQLSDESAGRKQAQENLDESELKFKAVFDKMSDGLLAADIENRMFSLCNPSICDMLGYREDEMLRLGIADIHPEEALPHVLRQFERQAERAISSAEDLPVKRKDGSIFYADVNTSPITLNGRPYLIGTFRDITERKKAEDKLRESELWFRTIFETKTDGMLAIGIEDKKFYICNPSICHMLGYSKEELLQLGVMDIHVDDELPHVLEQFERQLTGEILVAEDIPVKRKNGSVFYAGISSSLITLDGKTYIIGSFRDVTDRKKLQESEIARLAAETATRAKSTFLANMSHEIRTPMNAILGFSQLMQRDPDLTPRLAEQLETINRSGEHLMTLINDILEMSKIEAGRIVLNLGAFNLQALFHDVEMMLRQRCDGKQLSFTVCLDENVPRFVKGDEGKVRQVLVNILGNAVKFTAKGGIMLRAWAVRAEASPFRLVLEVKDTGPGISQDELHKLFKPFEQATVGMRTKGGTGLGLAISQEYVRMMGGNFAVESTVGLGSVFRFDIVLEETDETLVAQKEDSRRVVRLRPGQPVFRVLVADDKQDNRELLMQLLQSVGFHLRAVGNGEEALRAFEAWRPHLILMDTHMPVMEGNESIRRIRDGKQGENVKIISVTASAFTEDRSEMMAAGADDFIGKPFRENELFEKIRRLLNLEYEYEQKPLKEDGAGTRVTQESLAAMPPVLLAEIRVAIVEADVYKALALIDLLEAHDADIAGELRRLAKGYEYQALLDLMPESNSES